MSQAAIRATMLRLVGGRERKRQPSYHPKLPTAAEMAYVRELRGLVSKARARAMESIGPELDRMQREEDQRTDAAGDILITLRDLFAGGELAQILSAGAVGAAATRIWGRVSAHNASEQSRVLGITGPLLNPDTRPQLDAWRAENVRLIRSIEPELLADVLRVVTEAQATGLRVESLRQQIADRFGVAESRAELIARDQVLKANSDLSRIRQQRVGVTHYRWSTSKDSRVREAHAALDGKVFPWAAPPIVDTKTGRRAHPGQDFQCRCIALPVLD